MRATPSPRPGAAVTLLAVAAAVFLMASPAWGAETVWPIDVNANGKHLRNLGAPTLGTDALRLSDVAIGNCTLAATGVNGTIGCAGALGTIATIVPPLSLSGSSLSLLMDGTSVGINGGVLSRLAETVSGAVTGTMATGSGSLTTVFGLQTGLSLFGNWGSSSGVPIPNVASVPLSVPTLNSGGTAITWAPVTPASSGGVATWSLTGVRVFAVNPSGGSDTNQCWADSADATQANVAAATVTAWAKACATLGGASAELPPQLAGRTATVVYLGNGTTYADSWTVFDRTGAAINFIATGTNSTCGSTAGTGTTADLICQGAMTAAGMNATGYHPVSNATSNIVQLVKVGGGSPAFPAEPAEPMFDRFRGDVGNATTATQNHVNSVVAVTAADTIQLDAAITYTTADTFYLEAPGATAPGGVFFGDSVYSFTGMRASSIVVFRGPSLVAPAFTQWTGGITWSLPGGQFQTFTTMPVAPGSAVGPSRSQTFSSTGGSVQIGIASFATVGNFLVNGATALTFADFNVVGGSAQLTGGATAVNSVNFGGNPGGATLLSSRVLATLFLNGARASLGAINLPSTTQTRGVVVLGMNAIVFQGQISGGLKTNVGMDLSSSVNSTFTFSSPLDDGNRGLTVTGVNGDMYYGTATNIGNAPIYQSYTGLSQAVSGTVELSTGDRWTNVSSIGSKLFGTTLAVAGYNTSGIDIPSARLVRFGVIGDARDIAIAQADTFANAVGAIGMSLGVIKNGQAGWVATTGNVQVGWSDVAGFFPGAAGWPAYLSDTVAGLVTHDPPSGGTTVVRQICWSSSENECLLAPDNWTIGGGLEIGGSVSPGGPSNIAVGGILQRSAMTTSGAVVGTFAAGSNTAATTFGAAPALSGLFNTTNASAVPTWLACTGAGQVIQDTGTAMACAALAFTSLTSVPNFLLDPGGNGLAVRTASGVTTNRTLTSSGATITVTNGSGVAGNPNVDLPTQGTGPGSCTFCSVTFDAQGRETVYTSGATPALASTTVQGTAPINIAGDHATHDLSTNRVWALDANGVTNSFLAQMGAGTIKGNNTGSLANAADLTATQVTAMLNPFTSSLQGLAPSSGGGSSNFLRADGTWTVPPGTGVPTTRTLTMTAPMTCDAGSSCDLSANRTIATPVFVASGASHAPGLVPDPGSSAGTTRFLREDATWQTVTSGGTITLSGDATGSGTTSITVTNVNLPNGVTQAGFLNIAETVAPATPAAGHVDFFADSTQHNGAFKNSSGTLTYGAQVDSGSSHHFLQTFAATGAFTDAQPAFTDISGQATLAQSPSILSDSFLMNATGSSAVPSAVSPGTTSGIMEYVHGSPDTLTAFASGSQRIPFGSGTSGQFTDSASFTYDGSEEIIGTAGTQSVNFPFFGTLSAGTSIKFNTSINQGIVKTAGSSLYIGTAAGGADIVYFTNGVGVMDIDATQRFNWGGSVEHAAGLTMQEWINTPPSTASAASLGPVHDFRPITITLTGTTHNTSAKGHVYFEAPTITDASAVTVDDFPTVGISGGPIAAGSVTLTLAPALELFSGALQIDALSAGGMLKTNTHGDVVLATSGTDYQAPIGWPTATDIVISPGGTGSTNPAFDSNFTYNTTTHTLTSAGTNVLGSSTGIAYLTAGTLGTATLANYDSAEQTYYMEITTGSIVTINAGSQYIATNSSSALFGTSQIEYPTAGALPSFLKVSVCIVGTNTISTGGLDIFHSINGAGGVDATLSSSSSGCTSNASTNFGGTAADKFGIGLQADAGLGGGSVTLSGTLHLTIKIREAPVSTF